MYSDSYKNRLAIVFLFLFFCFIGLGGRLFYLQIYEYSFYNKKSLQLHTSAINMSPRRGKIMDRNGRQLAINVEQYSLFVNKRIKNVDKVASLLAPILKSTRSGIRNILKSARGFTWIKRQVSKAECAKVMALEIDGINFLKEPKRFYPKKELASNLIGFTGLDNEGLEGIENMLNDYIQGSDLRLLVERDAKGRDIWSIDYSSSASRGASVKLTIDENVQHICEQELDFAMAEFEALSAQVVILEPQTGKVLAMASRPTFNPNVYSSYKRSNFRNRTVTDVYEPGSTFKIVTASAALEEGVIAADEVIDCGPGYLQVAGHVVDDFKAYGRIPFKRMLEVSSNVGIIRIADILGKRKIYEYAKAFGFGEKTGIGLSGESRGILRAPELWSGLSLSAVPIGQEVAVTTLQMASAISVIANGGKLMRPYVVASIKGSDGQLIRSYEPREIREVISAKTSKHIRDFLYGATIEGTSHLARVEGYKVGGKTGTAQKANPETGGYYKDKYIMTFIGFAPYEEPRIAVAICLDSPTTKMWAANTAAPLFAKITSRVLSYLEVPRDSEQTDGAPLPEALPAGTVAEAIKISEPNEEIITNMGTHKIPSVLGLSMRNAYRRLKPLGVELRFEGSGTAVGQEPAPGSEIIRGQVARVRFAARWS